VFSATPVVPERPVGDSPQQDLLQLASSYETNLKTSNSAGDQLQVVNMVWAARSFAQMQDYYYVRQEIDAGIGSFLPPPRFEPLVNVTDAWGVFSFLSAIAGPAAAPTVIQTGPETTMETTTETTGVNFSIGGSVGYNQAQGLNATFSFGLTIIDTKTTTIPPVT